MAYVTGSANSIGDLLTAIRAACTAQGWSLSGNVLYKGTCYVELAISGSVITIRGGRGVDGSGNLTGVCNTATGALGRSLKGSTVPTVAFGWPVVYEVFINTAPDEVYVVCKSGVNHYQHMAWGQSAMPGLVGTGNWYSGVGDGDTYGGFRTDYGEYGYINSVTTGLFWRTYEQPCGVDHALDSPTWSIANANPNGAGFCDEAQAFLRQPNQWNGESVLIPIRVYASRPSNFYSVVLECAGARLVNLANLTDGQIITLGSDRWKVFPFWCRSTVTGSGAEDGSWYAGLAYRYDGP
jgi:hypothetical protein